MPEMHTENRQSASVETVIKNFESSDVGSTDELRFVDDESPYYLDTVNVNTLSPVLSYKAFGIIDDLCSDRFTLVEFIPVRVETDGEDFILTIDELHLYAFAKNLEEGIDELRTDIVELFEELREAQDDDLGTDPRTWKAILQSAIVLK